MSGPIPVAVFGDGVLTIPIEVQETDEMSNDLPANIFTLKLSESADNMTANNRDGRNLGTAAIGSLTAGIAKTHNELGPAESRAISGVMATPVAGPTTQAGP